jgi:CBS domain-containing protein
MMREEDTGIIPVVEPGETPAESVTEVQRVPARLRSSGRLIGLITDRDIVVRALAEGRDAREVRAEEIMSTELHAVGPNDRVIEAIRLMGDKQVRRVPVVGRDGNLRGIISMADVALETEADRELAEALEEISSGPSFWSRIFG